MKIKCDNCPAKNSRVRLVRLKGFNNNGPMTLCPQCIKAAEKLARES